MTTNTMRRIDYLGLCQFVSAKQAFSIRWCDRYYRMSQLYGCQSRLIQQQIDTLWGEKWRLDSEEQVQYDRLYEQWERVNLRLSRCWQMHSILIRYGQYFSNLPFRILRNQSIPECFWYVPNDLDNQLKL